MLSCGQNRHNKAAAVGVLDRVYGRILKWRRDYFSDYTFLLLLAVLVGLAGGLAAVFLKTIIHTVEAYSATLATKMLFLFIPILGIFIVSALKHYIFPKVSTFTGIGHVVYSIAHDSAHIPPTLTYSRMLTAGITMGLGGSAGLESPIVVTGSAIGANIARFFRLGHKYRTLFIGCGTAAGVAAIFNTPIGGILFALEVIIPHFSTEIFIPVLISAATGSIFSQIFMGSEVLFHIDQVSIFNPREIPYVVILGVLSGLTSLYYTRVGLWVQKWLAYWQRWYTRALAGGLILGLLIFLIPVFYGEGYISVRALLYFQYQNLMGSSVLFQPVVDQPWAISLFFLILIFGKPMAANLTIASGGDGGTFAPSFITGAFLGYWYYHICTWLIPGATLSPVNYILFGMSGMLAGVMHAPLTAIFIIAEMSGGYTLFIPLMLVVAIAYFTKLRFNRKPIYLQANKFQDLDIAHQEAVSLNEIKVEQLLHDDVEPLHSEQTLGELVQVVSGSKSNEFPVLQDGIMQGIIVVVDIRRWIFRTEDYTRLKVKDLMQLPDATVDIQENMASVLSKFDQTRAWALPVLEQRKFKGFIYKSEVYAAYRESLHKARELEE